MHEGVNEGVEDRAAIRERQLPRRRGAREERVQAEVTQRAPEEEKNAGPARAKVRENLDLVAVPVENLARMKVEPRRRFDACEKARGAKAVSLQRFLTELFNAKDPAIEAAR